MILTAEGEKMAEHGSYEAILYNLIPEEGLLQSKMKVSFIRLNNELS